MLVGDIEGEAICGCTPAEDSRDPHCDGVWRCDGRIIVFWSWVGIGEELLMFVLCRVVDVSRTLECYYMVDEAVCVCPRKQCPAEEDKKRDINERSAWRQRIYEQSQNSRPRGLRQFCASAVKLLFLAPWRPEWEVWVFLASWRAA